MSHSPQNEDCKYVEIVIKSDKISSLYDFQLDDSYSVDHQREEECSSSSSNFNKEPASAAAVTQEVSSCIREDLRGLRCCEPSTHVSRVVILRSIVALLLSGDDGRLDSCC
jgi:hypothetical protein